jgi:hypothetical protein
VVVVPAGKDVDKSNGNYLLNDKVVAYRQSDK